jgi:oligopeptide transport system substrate-binding protein
MAITSIIKIAQLVCAMLMISFLKPALAELASNHEHRCTTTPLAQEQIFRYNAGTDPETLDPGLVTDSTGMTLVEALFEGLLRYHPKSLKPIPAIAESYRVSKDGTIYTFELRPSQWHDGSPIIAKDFVRSWKRVLTPSTGSSYASQLYPIEGAAEFHRGIISDFSEVGVKALNENQLQVTLKAPCPYFLDLCAFPTLFPVPVDLTEKLGDLWIRPENILNNGAFIIKSWDARAKITLTPNPNYAERQQVQLKKIEAHLIDDQDTAYKLFLKGELDWISTIPLPKVNEAIWHPHYYASPFMGVYFYRFNVTAPPLDQKTIRQALSMSIDRSAITRDVLGGGELPASFFCPPVAGYQPIKGLSFNPDLANKLLDGAGYQDRSRFPELEIFFNTSEAHKKVAETLSAQWQENLGIRTVLRNSEWKVFLGEMSRLNFQLCRSSWIGDYGDPNTFFDLFMGDSGNNRTGWSNQQYDLWLKQSQSAMPTSQRYELFNKMESLLVEQDCAIMPIYIYVNKGMLSPKVGGWYENVRDLHPLRHLYIKSTP